MTKNHEWMCHAGKAFVAVFVTVVLFTPVMAHEKKATEAGPTEASAGTPGQSNGEIDGAPIAMPGTRNLAMPQMDAAQGRVLFVEKGCVACHSINGVGGHHATALDAHTMEPMMNPFDFAAKMWRMAPVMIPQQEEAIGEQIEFTGDELAHMIAFVHDDKEQHKLTEASIPPRVRKMMDHEHGEPGGGPMAHGKEIGHPHQKGDHGGMMHSQ